jgi:hypothetical protein
MIRLKQKKYREITRGIVNNKFITQFKDKKALIEEIWEIRFSIYVNTYGYKDVTI